MGKFLNVFIALTMSLFTTQAFATVGTVTIARATRSIAGSPNVRVVTATITASSTDGSVPNTTIANVYGCLIKVITNPGSTAPTDNYDITLLDPDDSTVDAANSLLLNRDTATTEAVYPLTEAGGPRLYLQPGTYTLAVANNSVNSAGIVMKMFFTDCAL